MLKRGWFRQFGGNVLGNFWKEIGSDYDVKESFSWRDYLWVYDVKPLLVDG
jgi:hypothetical protein